MQSVYAWIVNTLTAFKGLATNNGKGGGGYKTGRCGGGGVKFYPYEKGGGWNKF